MGQILLGILLLIVNALWWASTLLGLPGNWLIAGTTLAAAWLTWDPQLPAGGQMFHPLTLVFVVALALAGEIAEFVSGAIGAGISGGTSRTILAALVGGVIGTICGSLLIPVPFIGTLAGACGGAVVGAVTVEIMSGRSAGGAFRRGLGAAAGQFVGTIAKLMIGIIIYVWVAVSIFWP